MEGKGSYFILLVIVAFLSITLAFLAIAFFFFGRGGESEVDNKPVATATTSVPTADDLAIKVICEKQNFNLKKTSDKEIAVIVLSVTMKHFKTVDDIKEAEVTAKIDFYSKEINSALITYFQGLTLEDVSKKETKIKAEEELTQKINEILANGDSKASPIVYSIICDYWFYQ